jgi:hypothetical protein
MMAAWMMAAWMMAAWMMAVLILISDSRYFLYSN